MMVYLKKQTVDGVETVVAYDDFVRGSWWPESLEAAQWAVSVLNQKDAEIQYEVAVDRRGRFEVFRKYRVGDAVSVAVGSDSYPEGVIISIGDGVRETITTSTGHRFFRQGKSSKWALAGGRQYLFAGHHYYQDPSF